MMASLYRAIGKPSAVELPITLEQAKAHCRVDADFDDALITSYINAAVSHLERKYRISIFKKAFEAVWIAPFSNVGKFTLPVAQVSENDPISAYSGDLNIANVSLVGGEYFSYVRLSASSLSDLKVRFFAGWESAADIPEDIKILIAKLTSHYYENRDASARDGRDTLDFIVRDTLNHYRF